MKMKYERLLYSLALGLVCTCAALASEQDNQDQKIQPIKQQALELNRDLLILEEEILFPSHSRMTMFLSMDAGDFFHPDEVSLSIDGKQVTHHLYTQEQREALRLGGAQRLYMGNVEIGEHDIVVVSTGKGPGDLDYRETTEFTLKKASGTRNLELKISASTDPRQAEFSIVEIADFLHYRSALFYYFQQDYFTALTELMQAQQLDESGPLADNVALLRGGASLSYGMERAAQRIFETRLAAPGASPDRDRAWFYLGKLAWQSGALDQSAAALDRMAPTYHGELAPEANFLRASISLRQGDEQLAASYDTLLPADSPWLYYLYYNLGASHAARRDWAGSVDYFTRIVQSPLSTPEMKSLRDKALTASGYAHLAAENYERAAADFARVRLDSPLVDRALLGYGWAYCGMGDYRSAIAPWQTLGEQSLLSDSVRESLLALPYAHEQLGRRRTALEQYRHAGEVYAVELAAVQAAIEAFRGGWQLDLADDASQDWLNAEDISPRGDHLPYLRHLMTRHHFQLAMRELRDLQSMAHYLSRASQRLQALSKAATSRLGNSSGVSGDDRFVSPQKGPSGYAPRVRALQERVRSQERQVQAGLLDARARIRELAITELEQQAGKLQRAMGQSRLATARLYELGNPEVQR